MKQYIVMDCYKNISNLSKTKYSKKGQVAMEYLLVFSIAFLMSLILIIIFLAQTNNMQSDIAIVQLEKVSLELVNAVEEIYYMGEPSQKTIKISFPEGIDAVEVQTNSIVFNISNEKVSYQYSRETHINMTGTVKKFQGLHIIRIKSQGNYVSINDI